MYTRDHSVHLGVDDGREKENPVESAIRERRVLDLVLENSNIDLEMFDCFITNKKWLHF